MRAFTRIASFLAFFLGLAMLPSAASASSRSACTVSATYVRNIVGNRGQPMTFVVNAHSAKRMGPNRKVCQGLVKKGLVIKTRDPSFNGVRLVKGTRLILRFVSESDDQTGKSQTYWQFVSKK